MPKFNWHKGNRFPTYGNYTGPGNRTDPDYLRQHRPVDRLDRAAKFHDLAYKQLQKEGRNPYFRFSEADQRFIDRVSHQSGWASRLASGVFKAKKAVNIALGFSTMARSRSVSMGRRSRSRAPAPRKKSRVSYMANSLKSKSRARRPSRTSISAGHYSGKLHNLRKASKPGKYDMYGFKQEFERYGTQSLNEVCYLGATSYAKQDLTTTIGIAFYRKIMKKHYGFEYSHPDQKIVPELFTRDAAGPHQIRFLRRVVDSTGSAADLIEVAHTYTIMPLNVIGISQTLRQAGADFSLNICSLPGFGGGGGGTWQDAATMSLYAYQLVDSDYTVNAVDPGGGQLLRYSPLHFLDNQYFKCYSSVKMAIQNVTPADDGSLVTTKVDANPIKGKLVKFKDLLPKVRTPTVLGAAYSSAATDDFQMLQCDPNGDGIIKPLTSIGGAWQQIPPSTMFTNATKECSLSLAPGAIKDYSLIFKYSGTLLKFIQGSQQLISGANMAPVSGFKTFGTSFLFMLEKRMPTGAAPVSLNFHYESQVGAIFGRKSNTVMQRGAGASIPVTLA